MRKSLTGLKRENVGIKKSKTLKDPDMAKIKESTGNKKKVTAKDLKKESKKVPVTVPQKKVKKTPMDAAMDMVKQMHTKLEAAESAGLSEEKKER